MKFPNEAACDVGATSFRDIVPDAVQISACFARDQVAPHPRAAFLMSREALLATLNDVAEIALKIFMCLKLGEVAALRWNAALREPLP